MACGSVFIIHKVRLSASSLLPSYIYLFIHSFQHHLLNIKLTSQESYSGKEALDVILLLSRVQNIPQQLQDWNSRLDSARCFNTHTDEFTSIRVKRENECAAESPLGLDSESIWWASLILKNEKAAISHDNEIFLNGEKQRMLHYQRYVGPPPQKKISGTLGPLEHTMQILAFTGSRVFIVWSDEVRFECFMNAF